MYDTLNTILTEAKNILIIQADNPDADSMGSALALEQILSEMGKKIYLYCGVDMPSYLHYLGGWSRVMSELPTQFDASIVVDTSAVSLLQKLGDSGHQSWVATKPCIVLDHHGDTKNDIPYASVIINRPDLSSTGELIYTIAQELQWPLDVVSGEAIAVAILGDTQGLTNESATADTYRVIADLIDHGVNRPRIEELRRDLSRMDRRIFRYKATLIERTELLSDGRLALVTIPQSEINTYSPLYNPAPLIQTDMLQTIGVQVAIVMKHYDDGKILASIRCNQSGPIAGELAAKFGGGGHPNAAGFKITDRRTLKEVKATCIDIATELLDKLEQKDTSNETIQYTYSTD